MVSEKFEERVPTPSRLDEDDGLLELVPSARVGHIGICREPETLTAVEYFFKLPEDVQERQVIVVAALLASGNSAMAALSRVQEFGAKDIKLVSLLSCREGLDTVARAYPQIPIAWNCGVATPPANMKAFGENRTSLAAPYLPVDCRS